MKETKVILEPNREKFKEIIEKLINENFEIKASNFTMTKDPLKPYVYYALLIKEC